MEGKNLEERRDEERTRVINIRLARGWVIGLIAALVVVAFACYLALGQKEASASSPLAPAASSTGTRHFYLTALSYQGNIPTASVCTTGYHMAALWEILDTSNLEYATDLIGGAAKGRDDAGQGPPNGYLGWARTGHGNSTTGVAGQANCNGWSSNSPSAYGTAVSLSMDWAQAADVGAVWAASVEECDIWGIGVWCVED